MPHKNNLNESRRLPGGVWALGFVSMFMDISSEMIHGLLPVFLLTVIGASPLTIGFIEGLGEGLALISRVFSGTVSDWLGKRKLLAAMGYSLGALSKPLFAIAASANAVLTARSLDRFGKGLRGAPRDALVADLTPEHVRGAAYGLRQSLDSVGAFVGPLLAALLMSVTGSQFRTVFWLAAIPGLVAVAILVIFVRERERPSAGTARFPIRRGDFAGLGRSYWLALAVGIIFTLARFSEAFLLLRAEDVGMAASLVPVMLAIMSLVYALGAYPAGILSDRAGRGGLLMAGLGVLIAADMTLAAAGGVVQVGVGTALWGLHMALTQGLFASLVADNSTEDNRGTAFGVFGLATGIAVLISSVIAGWLWNRFGAPATFVAGGGFSSLALLALITLRRSIFARR